MKEYKNLKKSWMKFYSIFIIVFTITLYILLKHKFLYLLPFVIILFGFIERKFMKDSRDVEWKDLFSLFQK
jgi:MFS-type transporter involved in bile tolerance (Atg22 family)